MKKLDEKEWAATPVTNVFDEIQRGKRLKKADHIVGKTPYVSSTAFNNGVDAYVTNTPQTRVFCDCISLANSGSVGTAFYEPFAFVASDHVTHLKRKDASEELYLSLATILQKQKGNFSFNREINDSRIRNLQIMLPLADDGEPDYEYMSDYVQEQKEAKLAQYRDYAEKQIAELVDYVDIPPLNEKEWSHFTIQEIFDEIIPTKGKITSQLVAGNDVPYIAASKVNNGYVSMCSEFSHPEWVSDGNCIVFIQLGDGAAGIAHYIPMRFIGMNGKTACGYSSKMNKYVGVFISKCLSVNKKKFSHGHSWTGQRLLSTRTMLPINDLGEPDFEYMEQYAKNLMLRKYRQYIDFVDSKK